MTQREILEEIKRLTPAERLKVAEMVLRLIQADLQPTLPQPAWIEAQQRLASAAEALYSDYTTDDELIAFTALDSEEFNV